MRDISEISHFPLKVIFAVHFLLIIWAFEARFSQTMMLYNTLFFICLMWAIQCPESDEPIQFALFLSVAAEFFDFINLSVNTTFAGASAYQKFSASMVIINMVVRLLTTLYLLRIGQARGGSLARMFASPTMGVGRQGYEDISHPVPQNSDFAAI
ncbi:hypothetical protein QAD02_015174 [Eretmocerus hayati]|uniref:Uncharacterized protein n=1 Tax=Eretmocerus hayati TaxID=131215 RepID=A0ACC2P7Y6_9HYME|nr:hypothetical protein QAD02_015174 [Eretmocerus hayati]